MKYEIVVGQSTLPSYILDKREENCEERYLHESTHEFYHDNMGIKAIVLVFSPAGTYSFVGAEMSVILRGLLLSELACFMYLTVT